MKELIEGLKKFSDCSMPSNEEERIHKAECLAYNNAIDDVIQALTKEEDPCKFWCTTDFNGKCFNCGKQVFTREQPKNEQNTEELDEKLTNLLFEVYEMGVEMKDCDLTERVGLIKSITEYASSKIPSEEEIEIEAKSMLHKYGNDKFAEGVVMGFLNCAKWIKTTAPNKEETHISINDSMKMLNEALNNITNFPDGGKDDFILDIVNEYKSILEQLKNK